MKIIHPKGEATQAEIAELLEFAMEGRRRVKEQLKKMGSFEYYHTSFSYTVIETGEERFVGVPEQGGRNMISADPAAAGKHLHGGRRSGRHGRHVPRRSVRVVRDRKAQGRRRHEPAHMKESIGRAFSSCWRKRASYRSRTRPGHVGSPRRSDRSHEQPRRGRDRARVLHRGILRPATRACQCPAPARPRRHQRSGKHQGLRSLVEPLQIAMDNGAKRKRSSPIENKRSFLEVTYGDIVEHVDPMFFGDPKPCSRSSGLGPNPPKRVGVPPPTRDNPTRSEAMTFSPSSLR
jgi:ATP-dependent Lon protease